MSRLVSAAVMTAMLVGCRSLSGSPETVPPPPSDAASPHSDSSIPLPTVIPFAEEHPDLFDEDGCLRLGPSPSDVDCGLAPEISGVVDPSPHPDDSKHLLGFDGPFYTAYPTGSGVVMLDESVHQRIDSVWSATGLVRNELSVAVGVATVTATLVGRDGTALGEASGQTLIHLIRPGEPAPFRVESDVQAEAVASVQWSVSQSEPTKDDATRAIEATVFWSQPYGDRDRIESVLPAEPADPPFPFTLVGRVENHGLGDIEAPFVVFGWLDDAGRVIFLDTTPVRHFTVSEEPVAALAPDGLSGFVIQVYDPVVGPLMSEGDGGLILWTSGE